MRAAALNLLHRAHRARLENRMDDARRDLVRAVDICRAESDKADLAFALKRFGQIEQDRQDLEAALRLYEEAAEIYRQQDDTLSLAHTVRHIGDMHQDAGRGDLAAPCYEEALDLYRRLRRQAGRGDVANAVRSMAIHKEQAGEMERARILWAEARDLYASLDNPLRRIFRRQPNPGVVESTQHLARLAHQ
jgi:tetratricopeptide (TPR) repeat protein